MTPAEEFAEIMANAVFESLDANSFAAATSEQIAEGMIRHLIESAAEGWLIRPDGAHKVEEVRDSWADDGRRFWEIITEEDPDVHT